MSQRYSLVAKLAIGASVMPVLHFLRAQKCRAPLRDRRESCSVTRQPCRAPFRPCGQMAPVLSWCLDRIEALRWRWSYGWQTIRWLR